MCVFLFMRVSVCFLLSVCECVCIYTSLIGNSCADICAEITICREWFYMFGQLNFKIRYIRRRDLLVGLDIIDILYVYCHEIIEGGIKFDVNRVNDD